MSVLVVVMPVPYMTTGIYPDIENWFVQHVPNFYTTSYHRFEEPALLILVHGTQGHYFCSLRRVILTLC